MQPPALISVSMKAGGLALFLKLYLISDLFTEHKKKMFFDKLIRSEVTAVGPLSGKEETNIRKRTGVTANRSQKHSKVKQKMLTFSAPLRLAVSERHLDFTFNISSRHLADNRSISGSRCQFLLSFKVQELLFAI